MFSTCSNIGSWLQHAIHTFDILGFVMLALPRKPFDHRPQTPPTSAKWGGETNSSQFQVSLSLHLTIAQTLCPATGGVCFPSHEHEFVPPRTVEGLADARHRTVLADYVQVVGQIFKTSNDFTKGGFIGNRFRLRNPDASSLKNPCQRESVVYDPWRDWLTNARWVETFQHVCIAVLRSYWWSCFRVLYW